MPSEHQDFDDLYSRPTAFTRVVDGAVEKTFFIRESAHKLGELVVQEQVNGPLVKIVLEPVSDI